MNGEKQKYLNFMFLFFLMFSLANAQSPLQKHEMLASKRINLCANVQEGDHVLISGGVRDAALLDEIALQVRKIGAEYLVMLDSQDRNRRYFDVVPAKYDSEKPEFAVGVLNLVNVIISVDEGEMIGLFKDVPAERIAARSEASSGIMELLEKNNIRTVNLGNALYPTEALAKQFGISMAQLGELFWNGRQVF